MNKCIRGVKIMKAAKNRGVIAVVAIALICCVCYVLSINSSGSRLTAEQIESLRAQYPVCGKNAPAGIFMDKTTVEEVKEVAESFVYGEVVGDISTYNAVTSLANKELSEKRKKNGIDDVFEFYEYTISVIEDTEGLYSKGEEITIASNMDFINYNPVLSDGMKIVVPVAKDKGKPTRNHYIVEGMYYVTPDGYAIAAFDEESVSVSRIISSGVKVETLLKNLKK